MAMERSDVKYILQAALDRLNRDQPDTATWSDVVAAVQDARERKVKESLTSIVGGYNLADLSTALSVAMNEYMARKLGVAQTFFGEVATQDAHTEFPPQVPPSRVPTQTLTPPAKMPVPKKRK